MFIWLILILEFAADYLISRDLKSPATHLETNLEIIRVKGDEIGLVNELDTFKTNTVAYHATTMYRVYQILKILKMISFRKKSLKINPEKSRKFP